MPDRIRSAPVSETNVPMLPTTRETANVSGIHATILFIRYSLNASTKTQMTTAPAVPGIDFINTTTPD